MQNTYRRGNGSASRNGKNGQEPLVRRMVFKDKNGHVVEEKDVVTYAGLLSKAHDEGLKRISTKVVQLPNETNAYTAVVSAEVETVAGVFTGIGDANPQNVKPKIAPHAIRMAETRAKARALRDAVNVGVLALEELAGVDSPDDGEEFHNQPEPPVSYEPAQAAASQPQRRQQPSPAPRPVAQTSTRPENGNGDLATEKQRKFLFRLMADRGIEGEAAVGELQHLLGVRDLRQATKAKASEVIDSLVAEAGTNGGGA